ncbi:MAG: ABC transporter ATP-binding protein [Verrucomicrobiales bacterium]|nr:ABC transporter ATP-binding protein [Verrucomicrobiales bacterium]
MAEIRLDNVGVRIPVFGANSKMLKSVLVGFFRSREQRESTSTVVVDALTDVNLTFSDGDRVGLIGANGAGKSTFLRVLADVYYPTSGIFEKVGDTRCLFGLNSGLEMEGSGWDNIKYQARRIGVPKSRLDEVAEEVADFSELGKALDLPVRTYSQGMQVRLSFGVMTSIPADILLIDEVIGVGDASFMEKARQRMLKFTDQAKILVLASHSPDIIASFCNRQIGFEHGRVVSDVRTADTPSEL